MAEIHKLSEPVSFDGVLSHLDWKDETPPVRKWVVDGIIPAGTVTLLQGDGGLGKSLVTLQLAYACATGRKWLGQTTRCCNVMAVYCEDEEEEIQRRLWSIVESARGQEPDGPGLSFSELDSLLLASRIGRDNFLMDFETTEGGKGNQTKFLEQVAAAAQGHGAELIILDSLHDLFGGNENNRVQVRQFVNALQAIALEQGPAIVINGHPSLSGINQQTGTSGSTGWSNSVRSRLYLARDKAHPDEKPPFTGPLQLRIMKANYAAAGTHIELEWIAGVFHPKNITGFGTGQSLRDKKDQIDRAFMACLEEAYRQNRPPQYASNAKFSAPKMFAQMPMSQGFKAHDFKQSMERQINDKRLEITEVRDGSSRNKTQYIIPAGKKTTPAPPKDDRSDWEKINDHFD